MLNQLYLSFKGFWSGLVEIRTWGPLRDHLVPLGARQSLEEEDSKIDEKNGGSTSKHRFSLERAAHTEQ